jgi:hypothetical protein
MAVLRSSGADMTLEEALERFPEAWTKYLPRCFTAPSIAVLSDEHRAELALAHWALTNEVSQEAHKDLLNLLPLVCPAETSGSKKPTSLHAVYERLNEGRVYPVTPWDEGSGISKQIAVPVDNRYHLASKSDPQGAMTVRLACAMSALVDSLFDRQVIGDEPSPYVLNANVRLTDDGDRVYENLEDGIWWQETQKKNNGGRSDGPSKVFPIIIYIDEAYLTKQGTFTAKPLFVQAGKLASILPHHQPCLFYCGAVQAF